MKFRQYLIDEKVRIVGMADLKNLQPTYTTGGNYGQITRQDLKNLETILDRLFKTLGIEIDFPNHFLDRVNDARNKKPITFEELQNLFNKTYRKYGEQLRHLSPDTQGVIDDIQTNINVPFAINWDSRNKMLELVGKTILRKKNFQSTNKFFKV